MEILGCIFFAVALNIDSLGVGFSYGLRRIRLPFGAVLLISLLSMLAIVVSMLAGHQLGKMIPPAAAVRLGGIILIAIGLLSFYQYRRQTKEGPEAAPPPVETHSPGEDAPLFRVCVFGLIIQILKKPHKADLDMSGTISFREAFLLGAALAIDSMVAGVAVSLIGYSIVTTALFVGIGHVILLYAGLLAGKGLSATVLGRQVSALPSLILILIGVSKLY